jgi:A/G-specific adenine glycosylase
VWAGLFCLPWFDSRDELLLALPGGLRMAVEDLDPFKHVLTHKDMYLHPLCVTVSKLSPLGPAGQWFGADDWPTLGLPAPVRQLLLGRQACSQPNEVDG